MKSKIKFDISGRQLRVKTLEVFGYKVKYNIMLLNIF